MSIFLVNIDEKCQETKNILANQNQQHIKISLYHDKVGFIYGMQNCLNMKINAIYNNKMNEFLKMHEVISIDAE